MKARNPEPEPAQDPGPIPEPAGAPDPADHDMLRRHREDAVLLLRAVRETLAELLRQVVEGEGGSLREIVLKQAELESALRRVFEAEIRYDDWRQRHGGAGHESPDLDAARDEIGRRLDRLRAAGGAG